MIPFEFFAQNKNFSIVTAKNIESAIFKVAESNSGDIWILTARKANDLYPGSQSKDILIYNLDKNGSLKWSKRLKSKDDDRPVNIEPLKDSGMVLLWNREYVPYYRQSPITHIARFHQDGQKIWERFYEMEASHIKEAPNRDLFVYGVFPNESYTPSQLNDLGVMRLNELGKLIWKKSYLKSRQSGFHGGGAFKLSHNKDSTISILFLAKKYSVNDLDSLDIYYQHRETGFAYYPELIQINGMGKVEKKIPINTKGFLFDAIIWKEDSLTFYNTIVERRKNPEFPEHSGFPYLPIQSQSFVKHLLFEDTVKWNFGPIKGHASHGEIKPLLDDRIIVSAIAEKKYIIYALNKDGTMEWKYELLEENYKIIGIKLIVSNFNQIKIIASVISEIDSNRETKFLVSKISFEGEEIPFSK